MKSGDILDITKGLVNQTYFEENERQDFLESLDYMIGKTISDWNILFGSDEILDHVNQIDLREVGKLRCSTRIELDGRLKKVLVREAKFPKENLDLIERVRPVIARHLNILLSIREHTKKGGFVSMNETHMKNDEFREYIERVEKKVVDSRINMGNLEARDLWQDLQVIKSVIRADRASINFLKSTRKV